MARVRRWLKRIGIALAILLAVAIAAVVVVIHTDVGRELIREQVEASLDETFVGGASIERIEGSPFRELRLEGIVINDATGRPAIEIGSLRADLDLLPLLSKRARIRELIAEDVDVTLRRGPDGELEVARMTRPGPEEEGSWSVELPEIQIRRGHVAYDTGDGRWNFDDLTVFGGASLPAKGAIDANLSVRGTWRERGVELGVDGVARYDREAQILEIPTLVAMAGDAIIAGAGLRVAIPTPDRPLQVAGVVAAHAPEGAIAALVPGVALPAEVALAAIASGPPGGTLSLIGRLGDTPVRAMIATDLEDLVARGVVATGTFELGALTEGAVAGHAGGVVAFEARLGGGGELPLVARGVATVWGDLADLPRGLARVAFTSDGERLAAVVGLGAPNLDATLAAAVARDGEAITLDFARLRAATTDAEALSRGAAPVRGWLSAALSARGPLAPEPALAVTGTVAGRDLRAAGVAARRLALEIDATGLPARPAGRAELELRDVVRDGARLGDLAVTARSRRDGKIAVAVRAAPGRDPWRIELDALVTPPDDHEAVAIALQRHEVATPTGPVWRGRRGTLVIGPERIAVRDLVSARANAAGRLALSGTFERTGRAAGDLVAQLEATGVALDVIDPAYCGAVDAHIDVARARGRWRGEIELAGDAVSLAPEMPSLDASLEITAAGDRLEVAAAASSPALGGASVSGAISPPADLTDLPAWRRVRRDALERATLQFERFDLGRIARAAGLTTAIAGRLDGELQLGARDARGRLRVRDVLAPGVRELGCVDADLALAAPAPDELAATLTGAVRGVGRFAASARVAVPAHPFDPTAWRAPGRGLVRGATVSVDELAITPALLARAGIGSDLRGTARLAAELEPALDAASLVVELEELRGGPLNLPVSARLVTTVDATATAATATVRSGGTTLVEAKARTPVGLGTLIASPRAVSTAPLEATAVLPWVPAATVAGLVGAGRTIGGVVRGTIDVTGTVGAPDATAQIVASNLKVPVSAYQSPEGFETVENLTVAATWDGGRARVTIDGTQQFGSLSLVATGRPGSRGEGTIALRAKRFDLAPLLAFVPGTAGGIAGRLDADLHVRGLDPANAQISGELHLSRARVPIAPQVGTLRRAKLDLVIRGDRLAVTAAGRLGGGEVELAGGFTLAAGVPVRGEAEMTVRDVSPIGTIEPDVDADVKATLRRQGTRWIADVVVDNARLEVPEDRGEALDPVGAPPDMVFVSNGRPPPPPNKTLGPPADPTLVVNITITPTEVESEELRGIIAGKLRIAASADAFGIDGSIEAERGNLDLFGRRYQIERAAVIFDGGTDPQLDIEITYDFPDVTTITQVRGRLSNPELVLSSDPGLYSQGQLLGFLIGGEPNGDPHTAGGRDQITAAGTSIVANQIGGYVRKALPVDIDVLRYEAATSTGSAAITIGTWLTSSLFLAYRRHLEVRADENASEAEIEYWLAPRVFVEGVVGDRGYNGVDLLWRRRY